MATGNRTAATIQPTGPAAVSATIRSGTPTINATTIARAATKPTTGGYVDHPSEVPAHALGGKNDVVGNVEMNRLLAAAGLLALLVGLWLAISSAGDDETSTAGAPTRVTTPVLPTPEPNSRPTVRRAAPLVTLSAAGAYDPEGDARERDEEAGLAIDGQQGTAWRTERYSNFFKSGVGLVLDLGRTRRVERVAVSSPTLGARAEIRLGSSREGPFATVAAARPLTNATTFTVARRPGRYLVVWVVEVPDGSATEIAEVRVRARG